MEWICNLDKITMALVCTLQLLMPVPTEAQSSRAGSGGGGSQLDNAASDPFTCDASRLGQFYFNTTRNETLTCRTVDGGTTYAWAADSPFAGDVVNVLDFGAVSDSIGTSDDTSAFQDAIDYCDGLLTDIDFAGGGAIAGCTVYVPPGQFQISQLVLEKNVNLVGAGQRMSFLIQPEATNLDMIRHNTDADGSNPGGSIRRLRIDKVKAGTYSTATSGSGIIFCTNNSSDAHTIEDVWVGNFPDAGIRYGCPADHFGVGDPATARGGFVPARLQNVNLFFNGIAGIWLTEDRTVVSDFTSIQLGGDSNGWRSPTLCTDTDDPYPGCTGAGTGDATLIGSEAMVWIDSNCGGSSCYGAYSFFGTKTECGTAATEQTRLFKFSKNNNAPIAVHGASFFCASDPGVDSAVFWITDDDPGVGMQGDNGFGCVGAGDPYACCVGADDGDTCNGWNTTSVTWTNVQSSNIDHILYDESGVGSNHPAGVGCLADDTTMPGSGGCPWTVEQHHSTGTFGTHSALVGTNIDYCANLPAGSVFVVGKDHATKAGEVCICDGLGNSIELLPEVAGAVEDCI